MNIEPGQLTLIADLKALIAEAEAGDFGDFSSEKYGAPKIILRVKLTQLADNVVSGKYD